MLGNPKWFKRRLGGWGLTPRTWQGWLYTVMMALILIASIVLMNYLNIRWEVQIATFICILLFIVVDMLHMTMNIDKDERETLHEAFAERNASWVMVSILGIGLLYQAFTSIFQGAFYVDPFIIAAILMGAIAKGLSNLYLVDK